MAMKLPINPDDIAKGVKNATKGVSDLAQSVSDNVNPTEIAKAVSDGIKTATGTAQNTAIKSRDAVNIAVNSVQTAVLGAIDENGNGRVDIEDIIIKGLKIPGIRVDRNSFLKQEFFKNHTEAQIEDAVTFNPAHAGIPADEIDKIADEVIKYERNCVSGISTALGMPGGVAMAATIPADIAQFYGYLLRAAQKLMYLYGFPEINLDEQGQKFDTETINTLTVCMGVMFGVANANNALKVIAQALASGVEKKLLRAALTKGTVYPIVKSIASWFGKKMTKDVFAGFFKKSIPIVGGLIGGGITFLSFKPCCENLKASLQDTMLSNPEHKVTEEEEALYTVLQAEIEEEQ